MKKITNKKILNVFTLCIIIFTVLYQYLSFYLEKLGVIKNYYSINPAIVLYMSLPFLLFVYINDLKKTKRKLDVFDYIFYSLILCGLISTVFSLDKVIGLFGSVWRHEGLLSIFSYYLLFINWKTNGNKMDMKKFIKLFIIIAIVNTIYSLFQIYTSFNFIVRFVNNPKMASGLCGNPNFFGSLIVTVLSIITCKFLIEEKVAFGSILILIFLFVSLINSQSTGPFLTYIIVIIFLFIFLFKKKCILIKKFLILCIILILTYTSVLLSNKLFSQEIQCETCISSIKETVKSGGNGRLTIWENSLDIVKQYPMIGVGFDNFYLAYPQEADNNEIVVSIKEDVVELEEYNYLLTDNAHNVYLHTLVSTGILGLIPYLLLCLLTFIRGLKSKDKLRLMLLSGFVAYSIQAFANISVIQVAPIYYIIIGLILSNKEEPI